MTRSMQCGSVGKIPGDEQLLAQAFAERRILVTLDKDFGALVFAKDQPHSGVVRLPDVPAAQRVRLFERLLSTHEKAMADGAVVTVRGDRVRISR